MKVLVLYHSQTGNTELAIRTFSRPLDADPRMEMTYEKIRPKEPLPFPWPFFKFFGIFPETVLGIPMELETPKIAPAAAYDLIVLGYQPWHLSPSLPALSFLKSPWSRVFDDTPVITVISCRRMWIAGQEIVAELLRELGARPVGNLVVCQQGPGIATFVTTPMMLLTGKKKFSSRFLDRRLPEAKIAHSDLDKLARFGQSLVEKIDRLDERPPPVLFGGEAAVIQEELRYAEKAGRLVYNALAKPAYELSRPGTFFRAIFAVLFAGSLCLMILVGIPVAFCIKPFLPRRSVASSADDPSAP